MIIEKIEMQNFDNRDKNSILIIKSVVVYKCSIFYNCLQDKTIITVLKI